MSRSSTVAVAYDCLFPYSTGGGERQYRAFADELGRTGLDVDYLTAVQWDAATPREEHFRVVPVAGRLSLYSTDGVRRIPAALRYAAGLFGALLRRRRRYAAVIVSGLPIFNVFAARLALLGSGTRLVVDYLEVWHRRQWIEYSGVVTGTIAWVLQRAAIAITPLATCHSQLSATRLRREGLRHAPLVSPGLIDGAAEVAPPSSAVTPPYVLYVGRHIPDKRVEVLPAAVAAARENLPDLRLVVLGTGPSSEAVRAEVRRVGGEDWTDFPGFVSDAELDTLLHGALALANPSRREGYGLVVVEANAHGTPVILVADEGNAATELIDDGVNGVVSPTTRPADLARAIRDVAAGGDDLRRTSRAWYDTAVDTRTIRRTVDGIRAALALPAPTAVKTKEDTP
ncbi:glycosyltransferase involved in cell wall biosynthesis [Microbacterium testaceum]|uniref:glycosyltransferase family 4 protein n=1 Tax=Microbacterium TaxID=33882 RepID=UPI00277FBC38|nr:MULTISPECIES: glycosyltransferase family 4 protein [Microbacterium]MDQ1112997.1 glycosyltransferase involved in cell wall biosynthesis [Microbacterium testaceum]MDR6096464.1 glycosyltransferase involved in cell wall biosynthesis [Microbacterium sp. SORGH_AS_0454]